MLCFWDFILRLMEVSGVFFRGELTGQIYHTQSKLQLQRFLFWEKGSDEIKFLHIRVLIELDKNSLFQPVAAL